MKCTCLSHKIKIFSTFIFRLFCSHFYSVSIPRSNHLITLMQNGYVYFKIFSFLACFGWSDTACNDYHFTSISGKNLVQEFVTKEYRAAVRAVLHKALRGKETANFEFPLMTKSGFRIEVLLNATTRRGEQGNVIGVVGIGQDVSEPTFTHKLTFQFLVTLV